MSKRILFFGNERLATGVHSSVPTLQALIANGYEVAAIVAAQAPIGQSRQQRQLEIEAIAQQNSIPLLTPTDLTAASHQLANFDAEAAVLIAYGKIVPEAILGLFSRGIINIHPSLLPLHRGSAPIENVILNSEAQTGVSLIHLSAKMDAGPIYAQKTVTLNGSETKQSLADQLSTIGTGMVLEYLPKVLDGSLTPTPQNEPDATYDRHITKADSKLDWNKPAVRLEREVRAYYGWPRSKTTLFNKDIIVTKARVIDGPAGKPGTTWLENRELGVHTSEGILAIGRLIPAGKSEMTAAAFLAGYKPMSS
jgi:methionyl-tRNA formyltransferase